MKMSASGTTTSTPEMGDTNVNVTTESDLSTQQDVSATTKFTGDRGIALSRLQNPFPLRSQLTDSASTAFRQGLLDFLAKPFALATGNFATTDVTSTFSPFDLFAPLLNNNIYYNKISGFLGIRAKVRLRLQVNANRFQQGRYMLLFLPTAGAKTTEVSHAGHLRRLRFNATTATQLPHVEVDLATDTEGILEIDYVSAVTHFVINTANTPNLGSSGQALLYPYSPLVAPAGSTTCNYTIWISYHDVDLVGPTYPQASVPRYEPQANMRSSGRGGRAKQKGGNSVASSKTIGTTEAEQDSNNVGPIEGVAKIVSGASNAIGQHVPLLSAITAPVSWASDLVGGIAHMFGWSNPIDLSEVTRAVQTIFPYALNCDNIDSSMPLSLFSRNQLEVLPGFAGSDIDEMSIDFVKSVPAWYATFTATTGDSIGQNYVWQALNPQSFYNNYTQGATTVTAPTPVCFLANLFRLYRGSFRITFKIVKTEFHSGRFAIVFAPVESSVAVPGAPSFANTAYMHREIIDVRDGCEFTFDFPYTSVSQYRPTTGGHGEYGYFGVYCVNPITAPSGVSSSISVLMEVSGASDLEFALPQKLGVNVCIPYTYQSSVPSYGYLAKATAVAQGVVGNSNVIASTLDAARTCIGEACVSLLQLCKMNSPMPVNTNVTGPFLIDPWEIGVYETLVAGGPNKSALTCEYSALIRSCYAVNRGGMRLRAHPPRVPAASQVQPVYEVLTFLAGTNTSTSDYKTWSSSTAGNDHMMRTLQNIEFRGGAEVQVAAYNTNHVRPMHTQYVCAAGTSAITYGSPYSHTTQVIVEPTDNQNWLVMRSVSDDFQAGLFIGVPLLCTN